MKKKDCYLKFIQKEQCSLEEFRLAYYYRNSVNINRQIGFEMTMNSIMQECLQKMLDNKRFDNEIVRDIFEYHGLNDHYFGIFFQIYLQSFPRARELYVKLKGTLIWQFYENIYNEIKRAKFTKESELKAAENYHMSYYKVRSILKLVANKNYGIPENSFKEMTDTYKIFILFNQTLNIEYFKKAFIYYQLYATTEEKSVFQKKVIVFLKKLKNVNRNEISPIDLYNLSIAVPMDEELKLKFYATFKPYYDFCVLASWNSPKIKEEAALKNLKYEQYLLLAKEYAINCLHIKNIDDVIYYHKYIKTIPQSKCVPILEKILIEEDPSVLDELFSKLGEKRGDIIKYCYAKNRLFTEAERKEKERILFSKFNAYKLRQEQAKQTTEKKSYDDIFEQYINSTLELEDFCNTISISCSYFKTRLRKANDSVLINKVKEKLNLEIERKRYEKEELMKQIIFFIRNGISFQDELRPFDLLDFFYYYPTVNYISLKKSYQSITKEDLTIYNKFFAPLSVFPSYFNPDLIIHSYYEIDSKLDENGHPIKGTGIILSEEDFIQIIDFFERNQIPKLTILLDIAIKRYINQTLFMEDNLQNPVLSLK